MKRFAFLFWQSPLVNYWKFLLKEFDFLCYRNAEELQKLPLDKYEFIWWYLMWKGYEGWPLPKLARTAAPNVKILLMLDYWEPDKRREYEESFLPYVNALATTTYGRVGDLSYPNYYVNFPHPLEDARRQYMVSYGEREERVAVFSHVGCFCIQALETVKEAGYLVKLFSDIPQAYDTWVINHAIPGSISFPRLSGNEYLQELARCKVALEDSDEYYAFGRWVIDCSFLGVPVVGWSGTKAVEIGFPELATDRHSKRQVELIRRLMQDDDFRISTAEKGYLRIKQELSEEVCTERLKNVMRDMGIDI